MSTSDLDLYCDRIGYSGDRKPTLATLQRLHALHVATIAFENLSPFLGHEVRLDEAALVDKLLRQNRGGYCYEQNLLFMRMLEKMGFDVRGLAARVRWGVPDAAVTPRSHMLLLLRIDGAQYIADVGFGGLTLTEPLRFEPDVEQPTSHETFRLIATGGGYTLQVLLDGEWTPLYMFDLQEQHPVDYELYNWYVSTHPKSHFTYSLTAARSPPGFRYALRNTRYTVHQKGRPSDKRMLTSVTELLDVLESVFHLRVRELEGIEPRLQALIEAAEQGA